MTDPRSHGEEIAYYLGDLDVLQEGSSEWHVLYRMIEKGMPVRNARVMRKRVPVKVFDRGVVPRTTLVSRDRSGRLSVSQSERAVRVGRVYARAAEVFGDRGRGEAWMERPNPALDGKAPADLLANEAGARHVEELLGRLEHGVVA